MAFQIRRATYFYTTVKSELGQAYKLLSGLADLGINLLAFVAFPVGPLHTQLTIFPEDAAQLMEAAKKVGAQLDGPYPALLVQGDDELGALAGIHAKLDRANVNVFASTGVADGRGSYGYLLYVRPGEYEKALGALGI